MLKIYSIRQRKEYQTQRQNKKKEEEIKIALEKGAIAQKKMLAIIFREGRVQMKRTKPKQLTKKKTPPKRDEEEE